MDYNRDNLCKAIWAFSENVRCEIDSWDFKEYVLSFFFYRAVSEKIIQFFESKFFDYAALQDKQLETHAKERFINEKGFFLLPSELFCNVCKIARTDDKLSETLTKIFKSIMKI